MSPISLRRFPLSSSMRADFPSSTWESCTFLLSSCWALSDSLPSFTRNSFISPIIVFRRSSARASLSANSACNCSISCSRRQFKNCRADSLCFAHCNSWRSSITKGFSEKLGRGDMSTRMGSVENSSLCSLHPLFRGPLNLEFSKALFNLSSVHRSSSRGGAPTLWKRRSKGEASLGRKRSFSFTPPLKRLGFSPCFLLESSFST
mmetsp:Transcript_21013/g.26463  ORF Transcript_21013/g.26463 Transcript_21013/m.26463 type:complete len:205 (+) Transcript_21013:169-783(+)